MKCGICETETGGDNDLCPMCEKMWRRQEQKIEKLMAEGHTRHCACRQVWGDGECECDLYELGYDPYAWMKKR